MMSHKEDLYGVDAKEWLARWDAGQDVHSIEMGGLGPSYEQVIQIYAAEILRILVDKKIEHGKVNDQYESMRPILLQNKMLQSFGASGAQVGSAFNLARNIYTMGPVKIMDDPRVKDRHILVSKNFPCVKECCLQDGEVVK